MRHARILRVAVLAASFGAVGCTHNYYYGNAVPVCEAPVVSAPVAYGSVCEVPTRVGGGALLASGSDGAKPAVTGSGRPARVVISEPIGSRPASSRLGWRGRTDGVATTRVSGVYSDEEVTQ